MNLGRDVDISCKSSSSSSSTGTHIAEHPISSIDPTIQREDTTVITGSLNTLKNPEMRSVADSDNHTINPYGLYLLKDPQRGRGVFAKTLIPAGTVIEESPVLVLTKSEWEDGKMNDSILGEYGFCWSNGGMAIGLGLASLFNHSSSPNVNFIRNTKENTILFRTVKTIHPDQELCICYAADESKLWFIDSTATRTKRDKEEMSESEEETFPLIEPGDLVDEEELDLKRKERQRKLGDKQRPRERKEVKPLPQPFQPTSIPDTPNGQTLSPSIDKHIIHSPKPVHFSSLPDITLPPAVAGTLPPPLHSTPTPSPNTPPDLGVAELVRDLDWRAEDWVKKGDVESSGECTRIKGPAELEEAEVETGLMDIWRVDIEDPKLTKEILAFMRENDFQEFSMRHLKRVTRRQRPDGSGEDTAVALCTTELIPLDQITTKMASFHPSLADLKAYSYGVPRSAGRGTAEAREKSKIWPVNLTPVVNRPSSSTSWSLARREWVKAGVERILSIALAAKERGEIPVGVYCAAPPRQFWPTHDGFIEPTIGLRAEGTDTRKSANHPLRHSVLNCVRAIAHLRTVPPFSKAIPTKNGADYLLTSMTLFITHEPCTMCCMALLHSRVREVFYIFPRKRGGGFEGGLGIHGRKDLNHRFEVWRWDGVIEQSIRDQLDIDQGIVI